MKACLKCKNAFDTNDWTCPLCGHHPSILNGIVAHAPEFANGGGGFKPEYFSELSRLEKENFWFRARNELILWALNTYKSNANKFLEVGCGTGFVLSGVASTYPKVELNASEIFIVGLSYAAERVPLANFMQMDARQVPFVDEFDAIGAFDVLEHIEDDEVVLTQLNKALKPGGVLLLTVPQHPRLWSASDEYACHVRRYTCKEIEQKVFAAGFEILRSTSFVTILLPAMFISRFMNKQKAKDFDLIGELKIPSILNKIFYFLMKMEIFGIRIGINYPIGGSRLLVARKATK